MTESQLQRPIENVVTEAKIARFGRIGGTFFAIGGFLQGFVAILVGLAIVTWNYLDFATSPFSGGPTWNGLGNEYEDESILCITLWLTGFLLTILSFFAGQWAGRMLGLKKLRYGWVGIIAVIIPSIFAGISYCTIRSLMEDSFYQAVQKDPALILAIFSMMYFFPGIATGILASLGTRQKLAAIQLNETEANPSEK
ncbi:MAG: hypothetical protein RLZZ519_2914 [Bacteroidota bacterium]|jgi:hypothetical protein